MVSDENEQSIGRSAGGPSTKIHLLVDAHGNPLDFSLTPGQVHDSTQAIPLLEQHDFEAVIADKGCDADPIRQAVEKRDALPVIPARKNRKEPRPDDKHRYQTRHLVENAFAKLKQYRSVATRYDKTARHYASMVAIACNLISLRL